MRINLPELKVIASRFLEMMNILNIHSTANLESHLGEVYPCLDKSPDFIEIVLRPSLENTTTYTVSYTRPGTGIPLEIKVNPASKYSLIILKTERLVIGYSNIVTDRFGNIAQFKKIQSIDFSDARREISELQSA